MKLVEASPGSVVRNINNGSHYRFERQEEQKARIWPLELFPNGLLIMKPTSTTVAGDILVDLIGPWHENMVVEGKPAHSRRACESELAALRLKLPQLQADYDALEKSGVGTASRGSWANKIKSVKVRIEALERGLAEIVPESVEHVIMETVATSFAPRTLVQLPSGLPGRVLSSRGEMVRLKVPMSGAFHNLSVPAGVLREWESAYMASC